jgi:hypothetical protein
MAVVRTDSPAAARAVFNDHRLAHYLRHRFHKDARILVGEPAGGVGNNYADWFVRIILGVRQ